MFLCPACSAPFKRAAFVREYAAKADGGTYRLYRCCGCALEFWWPLRAPQSLYVEEWLPEYYRFHHGLRDAADCKWSLPFFERFPVRSGRLLDVGCADGLFLDRARHLGFEVYGIDFDAKSVKVAREKRGLERVFATSLSDFTYGSIRRGIEFNVVTFFEVLEHQDDPRGFIGLVRKLLGPGGWIAGSVPNRDRFKAECFRSMFADDFPPHHFTWWSEDVLRFFLDSNGFTRIQCWPCDFYDIDDVASFWEMRLLGRMSSKVKAFAKARIVKEPVVAQLNLKTLSSLGYKSRFLSIAQRVRNIVFRPVALATIHKFNQQGSRLYFQAFGRSFGSSG